MIKQICRIILYKWLGWTADVTLPIPDKCIFAVAPHTSNLDFIIGELYIRTTGKKASFLMKKDWFFWPLGLLLKAIGGIPVNRSKRTSLTDQLAAEFKHRPHCRIAVTPEGTRSKVEHWKRGFYYIAQKADVPILLFAVDYPNKRIVCHKEIRPSGDEQQEKRLWIIIAPLRAGIRKNFK